jgi:hypothetical protein
VRGANKAKFPDLENRLDVKLVTHPNCVQSILNVAELVPSATSYRTTFGNVEFTLDFAMMKSNWGGAGVGGARHQKKPGTQLGPVSATGPGNESSEGICEGSRRAQAPEVKQENELFEVLHEGSELVGWAVGDRVALGGTDLGEVVTDVFEGEVLVVVALA